MMSVHRKTLSKWSIKQQETHRHLVGQYSTLAQSLWLSNFSTVRKEAMKTQRWEHIKEMTEIRNHSCGVSNL